MGSLVTAHLIVKSEASLRWCPGLSGGSTAPFILSQEYMDVSENRGYPKNDGYNGKPWKTHLQWMIWGYHYFRKHPYLAK